MWHPLPAGAMRVRCQTSQGWSSKAGSWCRNSNLRCISSDGQGFLAYTTRPSTGWNSPPARSGGPDLGSSAVDEAVRNKTDNTRQGPLRHRAEPRSSAGPVTTPCSPGAPQTAPSGSMTSASCTRRTSVRRAVRHARRARQPIDQVHSARVRPVVLPGSSAIGRTSVSDLVFLHQSRLSCRASCPADRTPPGPPPDHSTSRTRAARRDRLRPALRFRPPGRTA